MKKYRALIQSTMLLFSCFCLSVHLNASAANCPEKFFDLTLPQSSKQCRVFGVKKPSTMSLFVVDSPENVVLGFARQLASPQNFRNGEMFSLISQNSEYRVYVYKDGQGTQVNIRAE